MKILFVFIVLFFSSSAISKDKYAGWGLIASSCYIFQEAMSLNNEDDPITMKDYFISGFQGYLTGINFWIRETTGKYKMLNENSDVFMFSYIENYCEKNPQENIQTGLIEYLVALPDID